MIEVAANPFAYRLDPNDPALIEGPTASCFLEFKAATLAMIRKQGAIVGWTAPLASF